MPEIGDVDADASGASKVAGNLEEELQGISGGRHSVRTWEVNITHWTAE